MSPLTKTQAADAQRAAQLARLTRGAALLDTPPLEGARRIPRDQVRPNPWQPRQHTDPDRLQELAEDIAARGILEPLIVRDTGDGTYQIVAGGRRYAAATIADLAALPCLIVEMDEDAARDAAIAENVHREDLDVEDEARYYQWLEGNGMSLREIAAAIHKSANYVKRRLDLLKAGPEALTAYRTGQRGLESARAPEPEPEPERVAMEDAPVAVPERNRSPQTATPSEPTPFRYQFLNNAFKAVYRVKPPEIPPEERRQVADSLRELRAEIDRRIEQLDPEAGP